MPRTTALSCFRKRGRSSPLVVRVLPTWLVRVPHLFVPRSSVCVFSTGTFGTSGHAFISAIHWSSSESRCVECGLWDGPFAWFIFFGTTAFRPTHVHVYVHELHVRFSCTSLQSDPPFFHVASRTAVRAEARLPVRSFRTHRRTSTSAAPRAARTPSTSLPRLPGGAVPPLLRLLVHAHVQERTSCFASCFALVLRSKHTRQTSQEGVSSPKGSGMAAEGGETDPLEWGARGKGVEMPGRMRRSGWRSVRI